VAQPDYVPIVSTDRVRPSSRLRTALRWEQDRPAEIEALHHPLGPRFGSTGPDLGFGLKMAKQLAPRAVLSPGEHLEDVVLGCFACGARRASTFHRAPVIYDMEWAYTLWGFFAEAPEGLVTYRASIFAGASHDYSRQRAVADSVPETALRLSPAQVASQLGSWRALFNLAP
jgi:hypothetical protein